MRMANALQSSGLIELNDTEHFGVTDRGESQPQQYPGREKRSAKGSRNYFKAGPLAIVRLFIGNTGLTPGTIGAHRRCIRHLAIGAFDDRKSRCAHTNAAIKLRA